MLGAGLVAKKAVELGLTVPPYVKTSLSPGSGVVTKYLEASGLLPDLEKLGYFIAGYGCMTCIGNSGPLDEVVGKAVEEVSKFFLSFGYFSKDLLLERSYCCGSTFG